MTDTELLTRLIRHFYLDSDGNYLWRYNEGVSLSFIDKELNEALKQYGERYVTLSKPVQPSLR